MDHETKFYSAGVPLAATVHIPDDSSGGPGSPVESRKYPMIILAHGYARYRNDGLDYLAKVLGENGFASLRFDHRGCGTDAVNRYSLRPMTEAPHDAKCAIDYCESLPFVDRGRIGMTGISMGGILSIIMGATDARIKTIAPMACTANCGESIRNSWGADASRNMEIIAEDARIRAATGASRMINRMDDIGMHNPGVYDSNVIEQLFQQGNIAYVTLESIQDLMSFNATEFVGNVRCPIFIIHGAEDGLDKRHPERLFEMLPPENTNKRIKIYEHVDHNIPICPNRDVVYKDLIDWFKETL